MSSSSESKGVKRATDEETKESNPASLSLLPIPTPPYRFNRNLSLPLDRKPSPKDSSETGIFSTANSEEQLLNLKASEIADNLVKVDTQKSGSEEQLLETSKIADDADEEESESEEQKQESDSEEQISEVDKDIDIEETIRETISFDSVSRSSNMSQPPVKKKQKISESKQGGDPGAGEDDSYSVEAGSSDDQEGLDPKYVSPIKTPRFGSLFSYTAKSVPTVPTPVPVSRLTILINSIVSNKSIFHHGIGHEKDQVSKEFVGQFKYNVSDAYPKKDNLCLEACFAGTCIWTKLLQQCYGGVETGRMEFPSELEDYLNNSTWTAVKGLELASEYIARVNHQEIGSENVSFLPTSATVTAKGGEGVGILLSLLSFEYHRFSVQALKEQTPVYQLMFSLPEIDLRRLLVYVKKYDQTHDLILDDYDISNVSWIDVCLCDDGKNIF